MARTITFYPAPSATAPVVTVTLHCGSLRALTDCLKEDVAEYFNCDEDDLRFGDEVWADGERFADFLFLDGRIIGSIDEHLAPREWTEFYRTRQVSPDDAPAISAADVFAAASAVEADCFVASLPLAAE